MNVHGIEITVLRKNIKNLYLRVLPPDGRLEISAPRQMSEDTIRKFVESKWNWVQKKQLKYREYEKEQPQSMEAVHRYETGEMVWLWGDRVPLKVITAQQKNRAVYQDGIIYLCLKRGTVVSVQEREKLLLQLYRRELQKKAEPYFERWQQRMGVQKDEWRIRDMKTRWGTCNITDRRIWLSLQLAKAPLSCLEYVIVHELNHLFERYHNKHFYDLMDRWTPDWRVRKDVLNQPRV